MGTLIKILIGGLALFLTLGGPNRLKKRSRSPKPQIEATAEKTSDRRAAKSQGAPAELAALQSSTFRGQPDNLITSVDFLEKNGRAVKDVPGQVSITYYLLARSDRCHPDSLKPCIKEKLQAQNIDPEEFQYTYFLDRVNIAGSGILFWQGRRYITNYARIRQAGWTSGERNFRNNYRCSSFQFRSKKAREFIEQNIGNEKIFTPYEKAPHPNGLTASGQEAVDWHTVSVNPFDFPLSVPATRRREQLTRRFATQGKRAPQPRSFLVLLADDGRMFLTEAMDTGSGVKRNSIDWRIGNTSAEIRYFFGIGRKVRVLCYTFSDPNITFEQVLAGSNPVTAK